MSRSAWLPLNDEAFSVCFSEANFYWLGFLFADGCLSLGRRVHLELASSDGEHVRKFRDFLGSGHSIRLFRRGGHESTRFVVGSLKLYKSLSLLGMTENKSLTAKAPDFIVWNRDFWRGMVDGDGSLCWSVGHPVFSLVGSEAMMKQFSEWALHTLGVSLRVCTKGRIFKVSAECIKAQTIVRALYEGSTVHLDRKKSVADEILKWKPKREPRSVDIPEWVFTS